MVRCKRCFCNPLLFQDWLVPMRIANLEDEDVVLQSMTCIGILQDATAERDDGPGIVQVSAHEVIIGCVDVQDSQE